VWGSRLPGTRGRGPSTWRRGAEGGGGPGLESNRMLASPGTRVLTLVEVAPAGLTCGVAAPVPRMEAVPVVVALVHAARGGSVVSPQEMGAPSRSRTGSHAGRRHQSHHLRSSSSVEGSPSLCI